MTLRPWLGGIPLSCSLQVWLRDSLPKNMQKGAFVMFCMAFGLLIHRACYAPRFNRDTFLCALSSFYTSGATNLGQTTCGKLTLASPSDPWLKGLAAWCLLLARDFSS